MAVSATSAPIVATKRHEITCRINATLLAALPLPSAHGHARCFAAATAALAARSPRSASTASSWPSPTKIAS